MIDHEHNLLIPAIIQGASEKFLAWWAVESNAPSDTYGIMMVLVKNYPGAFNRAMRNALRAFLENSSVRAHFQDREPPTRYNLKPSETNFAQTFIETRGGLKDTTPIDNVDFQLDQVRRRREAVHNAQRIMGIAIVEFDRARVELTAEEKRLTDMIGTKDDAP
jgi:hypothetical protein